MQRVCRKLRQVALLGVLVAFTPSDFLLADEIDVLAISHDFNSLPRALIVISPVPQPPKSEGKLKIADSLGRIMTEELIASLQREVPAAQVVALAAAPDQSEGLVLDARFSRLVPGSRAKRFWLGFGAGKSVTEVSGEVRDLATGRVVARFTQARLSWCCGFGSNDHEIRTNLVNAADDIAAMVAGRFHADQSFIWLDSGSAMTGQPQADKVSSEKAVLQVDASSKHAEVYVNGNFVGTTPLAVKLDAGPHRVVVKKRAFQDWTREVQIIEGSKQALWANLEETATAEAGEKD